MRKLKTYIAPVMVVSTSLLHVSVMAGDASEIGVGGIATTVNAQLEQIAQLVAQVAFVAGMLFFVAAIFKFKQHKDNPTQVPVGTPLSMIVISAALMFMGNFIQPLGETLFGAEGGEKAGGMADTAQGFKTS